ncbi:D-2-hydroxyacid dehydrogenase [Halocatena marina]|uniref:D-2-hydroxyacid dehydrogenase n=1 Tax=Halocatena marina TaxID=2934937 RepID=UPI00200E93C0|nr:D-2-hydroxyacid dehydrogenase [Halocatena marina]
MDDKPPILLPYTVSSEWVAPLRSVLTTELPDVTIEHASTPPASRAAIETAPIVVAFGLPDDLLACAEELQWVQALSAGVNTYDVDAIAAADAMLTTVSGIHAQPIAEQVLGYMFAFERGIHTGIRQQQRAVWERYTVGELADATLGIVGVGAIGQRIAELASAIGIQTLGIKRNPDTGGDCVDELFGPEGLYELLLRADYVVLACPLTDETRGLIGREELQTMNEWGVLINIARGDVVDEETLIHALQYGWIRGAALDVFSTEPLPADSPLWKLSNVIVTPHMAGLTPHYMERSAAIIAQNYRTFVAGDLDAMQNRIV